MLILILFPTMFTQFHFGPVSSDCTAFAAKASLVSDNIGHQPLNSF
jgi:hypothetical protein